MYHQLNGRQHVVYSSWVEDLHPLRPAPLRLAKKLQLLCIVLTIDSDTELD